MNFSRTFPFELRGRRVLFSLEIRLQLRRWLWNSYSDSGYGSVFGILLTIQKRRRN